MQEYGVIQSKMKFKETSFTFHISRESFKPVRQFREITYMLLKIITLVCSKATFLFLLSFFLKERTLGVCGY